MASTSVSSSSLIHPAEPNPVPSQGGPSQPRRRGRGTNNTRDGSRTRTAQPPPNGPAHQDGSGGGVGDGAGGERGTTGRRGRGSGRGRGRGGGRGGLRGGRPIGGSAGSAAEGGPGSSNTRPNSPDRAAVSGPTNRGDKAGDSRRQKAFGTRLTNREEDEGSSAHAAVAVTHIPATSASLTLLDRLSEELSKETYDCSICFSSIGKRQPIYTCSTCFSIFHLRCISKWATKSCHDSKERMQAAQGSAAIPGEVHGSWRCPGCQVSHEGEDTIPTEYRCFCGNVKNPNYNETSRHSRLAVPHSCGKQCRRDRPAGCAHPCSSPICHPGPCPPCPVVLHPSCYCGKQKIDMRCSQLHSAKLAASTQTSKSLSVPLSCSGTCGRPLNCGLHSCKSTCHPGPCEPCSLPREKVCYCGATKVEEECGSGHVPSAVSRRKCYGPDAADDGTGIAPWTGEFSCDKPCPWFYACGQHRCEGGLCHPHEEPTNVTCPRDPSQVSTCPCGKTPLAALLPSGQGRESCTSPIPTCDRTPCGKVIPDCGHLCRKTCHSGPCDPCTEDVVLVCRCGSDKITRRCQDLKDEAARGEAEEFRCAQKCRAMLHCRKHICGQRCCPLSFQEAHKKTKRRPQASQEDEDPLGIHACNRPCGRKLSCGLHSCPLLDHSGTCPPCLQSTFHEVTCHCGGTVLEPPVSCGTRVICHRPCARLPPLCGHPKTPHTCHDDSEGCPPCPFLTTKVCQCYRKNQVQNVRCSQETVSCGKQCGRTLSCGAHACRKLCHQDACEACHQVCGKARKLCAHFCQYECHAPTLCFEGKPCTAEIELTCPCGHNTEKVLCGSCNARPQGNRDRILPCTEACVLARRNAALAEALGIEGKGSSSRAGQSDSKILWSSSATPAPAAPSRAPSTSEPTISRWARPERKVPFSKAFSSLASEHIQGASTPIQPGVGPSQPTTRTTTPVPVVLRQSPVTRPTPPEGPVPDSWEDIDA